MGRIYEALQQAERDRVNGAAALEPLMAEAAAKAAGVATVEPAAAVMTALAHPAAGLDEGASVAARPAPSARACMWEASPGVAAEGFRRLALELEAWQPGPRTARAVLITSATEGAGKSTVALNLAAALARSGQRRVLLVEAAGYAPALAAWLGLGARPGLADWLRSQEPIQRFCLRLVPWPLYLLPAGEGGWSLESLEAAPMCALLAQLRAELDWILLDGPAMLPVAEAMHWAQWADGVLLVARVGHSRRPELAEAWSRLAPAKRLGWVLNQAGAADQWARAEAANGGD